MEYNPVADKWRVVTSSKKRLPTLKGVGAGGVLYLIDPMNSCSMEGYVVSSGQWVEVIPARLPPGAGFLVGTCGTPSGHVYIITHSRMELRFWRWVGIGHEWMELEAPKGILEELVAFTPEVQSVLQPLWRSVLVSCVAVRDERVVAIVKFPPWPGSDRLPNSSSGLLVYNVANGSWT